MCGQGKLKIGVEFINLVIKKSISILDAPTRYYVQDFNDPHRRGTKYPVINTAAPDPGEVRIIIRTSSIFIIITFSRDAIFPRL